MVAFIAIFSQTGAMVLLISPEGIQLESCACAQNIPPKKEIGDYTQMMQGIRQRGRNVANLISDGGGLFSPFFSNWCHGSANIS